MSTLELPADSQLNKYCLKNTLGLGGFGITYKAYDNDLQRYVAIKEFLLDGFSTRLESGEVVSLHGHDDLFETHLNNFVQEARSLARFSHSNIVKVLDYFRENGTAYLVMEYIEGETLVGWLRRNEQPTEPDLINIFSPVLDGLHALHSENLLHRDIKPENIYIYEKMVNRCYWILELYDCWTVVSMTLKARP